MSALARGNSSASKKSEVRQELVVEQRRLAKLWDAFKKQEDEYRQLEKERDDLWSRVQELEKATNAIGDPAETLARLETLDAENEKLRTEVTQMGGTLEENRKAFHAEQERLAKLYKVYEDAEARSDRATKDLEKWHKWWAKHGKDLPPKAATAAKGFAPKK